MPGRMLAAEVLGLDCQARATWGAVAGESYDDRLYALSPVDGEVIWKGSGSGESTPVRIHAKNCANAPVDRISDQDACAATTGLAAQPTLPLGQAYGKAPRAQTRRSGPHRVCLSAM
jgi:hypothetical protein